MILRLTFIEILTTHIGARKGRSKQLWISGSNEVLRRVISNSGIHDHHPPVNRRSDGSADIDVQVDHARFDNHYASG